MRQLELAGTERECEREDDLEEAVAASLKVQ